MYTNSPEGGELVSGCMGISNMRHGGAYIQANIALLDISGWAIGRESAELCEVRPGSVSAYAGVRR